MAIYCGLCWITRGLRASHRPDIYMCIYCINYNPRGGEECSASNWKIFSRTKVLLALYSVGERDISWHFRTPKIIIYPIFSPKLLVAASAPPLIPPPLVYSSLIDRRWECWISGFSVRRTSTQSLMRRRRRGRRRGIARAGARGRRGRGRR
jgi:hypothetical protein